MESYSVPGIDLSVLHVSSHLVFRKNYSYVLLLLLNLFIWGTHTWLKA